MTDYHHTVLLNATPIGEFTKWWRPAENGRMENQIAGVRRANLARLIDLHYGGNKSAFARAHDAANPKPTYFSDLLRENSGKSFGEKAARAIEDRIGLLSGQLDIPNSPLVMDESRRSRLKDELHSAIESLDKDEQRELLVSLRKIQSRRRGARKAG